MTFHKADFHALRPTRLIDAEHIAVGELSVLELKVGKDWCHNGIFGRVRDLEIPRVNLNFSEKCTVFVSRSRGIREW